MKSIQNTITAVCLLLSMSVFIARVSAQALTASALHLYFSTTFENAPDSLPLTLTNQVGRTVTINGIRFYNTYGSPAFSTINASVSIPAFSSSTIWIKFSPRHNIFHNSEMVIENDGLRGPLNIDLAGQGSYSNPYYNATENHSEEDLKTTLHTITGNGYLSLGYNVARDSMFMSIDNQFSNGQGAAVNTIEGVYSGILAAGYIDRADCQTRLHFNTEHTFPQSLFSSMEPMKSDLHHLFPTDDAANTERADNPFGVVNNPSWTSGGSKSDGSVFEPRDVHKGKVARALFYFVLRYQNYNSFVSSQESILRNWQALFPPTAIEIKRNNDIYSDQHNRNPFVDYPQFLERISSICSTSVAAITPSLDLPEDTIVYGFVQAGSPAVYHYVIVNNGNTDAHFSAISLSHPGILAFASGGNDTTIAPGDALGIDIRCTPVTGDSIHGWLNFHSDIPGYNQLSIPIYANDSLINTISIPAADGNGSQVFPNPVQDYLHVRLNQNASACYRIRIYDLPGKSIMLHRLCSSESTPSLDLKSLVPGIYFLEIENTLTGIKTYNQILKN